MFKRLTIFTLAGLILVFAQATPTFAQGTGSYWSIGGGWWNMSDFEGYTDAEDNFIPMENSGTYISIARVADSYLIEFDWSYEDPEFICMVGDYLYPLSGGGGSMGSFYVGFGYTNFTGSTDGLKDSNGFNVLLGFGAGGSFSGTARYDFIGDDQDLLTVGASYVF